jgi:hypothetical protein
MAAAAAAADSDPHRRDAAVAAALLEMIEEAEGTIVHLTQSGVENLHLLRALVTQRRMMWALLAARRRDPRAFHAAANAAQLLIDLQNGTEAPPPPPPRAAAQPLPQDDSSGPDDASDDLFDVERIDAHRLAPDGRTLLLLLKWKGYPDAESTWEPISNLIGDGALALLRRYQRAHPEVELLTRRLRAQRAQ